MSRFLPSLCAFLAALAPPPAAAGGERTAAVDVLLARALAEHRVFLTCTALDRFSHAYIRSAWEGQVAEALDLLETAGWPAEARAAFAAAATPEALMPPPETPFAEVRAECDASPDWSRRLVRFDFLSLPLALPEVLGE